MGWSDFFARSFEPYAKQGFVVARVANAHRHNHLDATLLVRREVELRQVLEEVEA
ncbi:MAG: hypothetical protein HRU34_08990 [Richelia sp.]|nr:hypothetical protein [Richelia sp.]